MTNKKFFLEYLVSFSLLLLYLSTYQVADTENAICISSINFLNKNSEYALIQKPGLHFKRPLLDRIILFDKRVQRTLIRSNPLVIEGKGTMRIDYLINWRVQDSRRYVKFMSHNEVDFQAILSQWSHQFLQHHWRKVKIETSTAKQFDRLQAYLKKQGAIVGIDIISCDILQKIPSAATKKNILQRLSLFQTTKAQQKLHQGQLRAHATESAAKLKQAELYNKARIKLQNIQNEAELLVMQTYLEAYKKSPKFAAFYQNLQSEALAISQDPEFSLRYQNLEGYIASFKSHVQNTALLSIQNAAA